MGTLMHRRVAPVHHQFQYALYMSLVDLDDTAADANEVWLSLRQFCAEDYLSDVNDEPCASAADVKRTAQGLVAEHIGKPVSGKVFLLTHLRQWGLCFNPVSFYFCIDKQSQLIAIVAEITNTPWGERYQYVLHTGDSGKAPHELQFEFDKSFHVSPFMPMALKYRWSFKLCDQALQINMNLIKGAESVFSALLKLNILGNDHKCYKYSLLRFPLMCHRVLLRIYWQALLLKIKKIPFYKHPRLSGK